MVDSSEPTTTDSADPTTAPRPDWPIFLSALTIVLGACLLLFTFPSASKEFIDTSYDWITKYLGIVYLWSAVAILAFCLWIALSPYGRIKLGAPDSKPRFSLYSWASMLFCAGVATGILYWGTIEWVFYYEEPPFGVEPASAEAVRWASVFGIFHWGPTGWAYYCVPALAIGHAYYCRRIPRLRVSTACHAVLGSSTDGLLGRMFDVCFMIGLLGAAGTSLGFGTPMIAAGFSRIFGIEESYGLTVLIAVLCTMIFGTSVYLGLERGIRRLSDINMAMTLILLVFIVMVGPTRYLFQQSMTGLGTLATGFWKMHAVSGPFDEEHFEFARAWTVFYWAWWVAVGPFMGVFIAQISHGRTFRQIVIGALTLGSLGSALFYMIMGNYALSLQLNGQEDIVGIKGESGPAAAIISVVASLPWEAVTVPFFCLISLVFLATSYDSASFALASSASHDLAPDQPPARWHRMFWAFVLALLPTALLFESAADTQSGRLKTLQTAALLVSVPLLLIFIVMCWSLLKAIRQDARANQPGNGEADT